MPRRLWAALVRACAYVLSRWADRAVIADRDMAREDERDKDRRIKDLEALIDRLEADIEYNVTWRAREIASLKAETAARVAQQILAGEKREE